MLPAFVVTLAAFNGKAILSFPPETWSLRWFAKALAYEDFQAGFRNGLIVTAGRPPSRWWSAQPSPSRSTATSSASSGRSRPCCCRRWWSRISRSGSGFLILAAQLGLARGYAVIVACHVVLVLPFVLRSVYISLRNLDQRLELAAASLGAPPARVLVTVTLPLLLPGLVSGWLFAAILSFNEFTASLFVTAQRTQTLPVAMYNYVREYADPSMAAISVMYIVVTATLLTFANVFLGLGKVLNVEHAR